MELTLSAKDLVYLGSILIGFLVGILLLIFGFKKNKANLLIGLSFFCINYSVFLAFLIDSGYHVHLPQLYRTGNISALLFAPITYFYIRAIRDRQPISSKDFFHFLPVLIYLIDFFPILFLMTVEEKLRLIQSEIHNPTVFTSFNQSRFFPPNFYTLARTGLIAAYWFFSMRILFRPKEKLPDGKLDSGSEWLIWMKIYILSNVVLFLPFVIFANFVDLSSGFDLIHFTGSLTILIGGVGILFFPKVLYGLEESGSSRIGPRQRTKYDADELSELKETQIQKKMDLVFFQEKKYLKKGYSINDLSKDTQIPEYLITRYINGKLNTNFSDLINQNRIEESCLLMDSGRFRHLTLEGMADKCGFNNRNSFAIAFKKFKGVTPSQYQKSKMNFE